MLLSLMDPAQASLMCPQTSLINALQQTLHFLPPGRTLWVAYSGGLDSHCLLHVLATSADLRTHYSLRALHVHHGLSTHADQWAEHCLHVCRTLAVDCQVLSVTVQAAAGESWEAAARAVRYQVLSAQLGVGDGLLTGHHQEDQAETFLLQLLRGAGPKGLASMAAVMPLGCGYLVRPWLTQNRQDLHVYAETAGLQWIEDDSNADCRYDRNFLRQVILPQLKTRWPSFSATIARSAHHCAVQEQLLQDLAAQDWAQSRGAATHMLKIAALQALSVPRQQHLLRHWLHALQLPMPSTAKLTQMIEHLIPCREDASPCVAWPGAEVRRYREAIYALTPMPAHDPGLSLPWDLAAPLPLPAKLGTVDATQRQGRGLLKVPSDQPVTLRFRQQGERFHPYGRSGSHPLKKLLQAWGIPPWQRDRVPLLYVGEQLAVVIGYAVAREFATTAENEWGYLLVNN